MTNNEIILQESIKLMEDGIIGTTGREITLTDDKGKEKKIKQPEIIHTYQKWQKLGQQVKKGSKAIAKFKIWKFIETEEEKPNYQFMKMAAFFSESQCEPIPNWTMDD